MANHSGWALLSRLSPFWESCRTSHYSLKRFPQVFTLSAAWGPTAYIFQAEKRNLPIPTGLLLALILAIFSVIFGARRLVSSERHEGLIAAVAFESLVKLFSMIVIGILVTYFMYDGFGDIFSKFRGLYPADFVRLFSISSADRAADVIPAFTMLFISMGAFLLLPRQFHVMVIENSDERHITKAMWLFPAYMFLINLFVMPIALCGILTTGNAQGADFFLISIPILSGHHNIATLAFLGGVSAAAGMVIVESVAISTMLLNHIFMPIIVRFKPQAWFPFLLINLKRLGIFLVIFLGYFYFHIAGDAFSLANMGMISFVATCQFIPAMLGSLFWRHGNCTGALTGLLLGFSIWLYTLLLPSLTLSGWLPSSIINYGPFGLSLLKPTALFGLTGLDMWSHSLFWSIFINSGTYVICSILLKQSEQEREQLHKFFGATEQERRHDKYADTKRLSKPVTINSFVNLMTKFIGEKEARLAIGSYMGTQEANSDGHVSEFELPNLKRYTEKTLAASVGAAAAGAIVDSFLSDIGSRMESVFNIFSTVRTSLDQSREALYVRLKASEIINRTLDIHIIMDDLLHLLLHEFNLDIATIQLCNEDGVMTTKSIQSLLPDTTDNLIWLKESQPYFDMLIHDSAPHFVNDTLTADESFKLEKTISAGIASFGHFPIHREGEPVIGVISIYSKSIKGLFTEEFIGLLSSLAGQLAQAITIVREVDAKEREREQKEQALLKNAVVQREMEIAQQIQTSLLPSHAPFIKGIEIAGRCKSAAHVGGDYYDFFVRDDKTLDFLIADVSGHSVGAALIMTEVRTLLRPQMNSAQSASSILGLLNNQLYGDLSRTELLISMFYAKYHTDTRILSYANAGHNPPMILRNGAESAIELDADGLILGVIPSVKYEELNIELFEGDAIIFYTDGLVEASNHDGELYGTDRILQKLKNSSNLSPEKIIDDLYREVEDFTGNKSMQDDISIIVLKVV